MDKRIDNNKRKNNGKHSNIIISREKAIRNMGSILGGASFQSGKNLRQKDLSKVDLSKCRFEKSNADLVSTPHKAQGVLQDIVTKLEASESQEDQKRLFCTTLFQAFFVWSKKENAWDRELSSFSDKNAKFCYELRKLINSLDVSKIESYIKEKDELLKFEVDNINYNNKHEMTEAITLILEEGIKKTRFNKNLDVLNINRNSIYDSINEVSLKIVEKLSQNEAVVNWDTRSVLKLLLSAYIFLDQDIEPKFLMNSKLNMAKEGVIRNLIGFKDWFCVTHSIMFNVVSRLIKDNPKEKLMLLREDFRTFISHKSLKFSTIQIPHHEPIKDTIKVISDYAGMLALVLPSVESYINQDTFNKIVSDNSLVKHFPFKELSKESINFSGYVYLCQRDKQGNVTHIFYDADDSRTLLAFSNNKFLDDHEFISEALYDYSHIEKLADIRNSKSVWLTNQDIMYFSYYDIYVKKDDSESMVTKDNIKKLHNLGLKILSNIDYRHKGMLSSFKEGDIILIAVDELKGRVHYIANTGFYVRYMNNFVQDMYGYHKEVDDYFTSKIDVNNNNNILILEIPLNSKFGYIDDSTNNIEAKDLNDDNAEIIIRDENAIFREKILRYVRRSDQIKRLSLSWLNEFFKPYGGIIINETEGVGSHYKIRLNNGLGKFWTVSKNMRENGIYISSLITIIDSLKLSYKDVYEKCIQDNLDKNND